VRACACAKWEGDSPPNNQNKDKKLTSMDTAMDTYTYQLHNGQSVKVVQDTTGKTGTGSTVWDTSLVLAKLLEKVAANLQDTPRTRDPDTIPILEQLFTAKRIVEIGSGTGLLSLVLAKIMEQRNQETHLVMTDGRTLEALQLNLSLNISPNSPVQLSAKQLMWGNAQQAIDTQPPFDLIICSDCIAWPELYSFLIDTIEQLSQYSDKPTMLLFGFERRNFDEEAAFFAKLGSRHGKWRFRDVKESEQDTEFASDDIFVFVGSRKP
jgi:hypothetical protein